MATIWICSEEISDSCLNLTVCGLKNERHHKWVCPVCSLLLRRSVVRQTYLGHSKEEKDD
jgi:hypothetical protein